MKALLLTLLTAELALSGDVPPDMVWIPGGEFSMGSDLAGARRNEQPVHRVSIDGFWLDVHPVTNAEFKRFVEATGYKTTAERPVDWEELRKQLPAGTPRPPTNNFSQDLWFSPHRWGRSICAT